MRIFLHFVAIFLINIQATFSDGNLETLKKLLSEGLITEEEFKKASSKSSNSTEISNDRIKIKKSTTSKNVKFVKNETVTPGLDFWKLASRLHETPIDEGPDPQKHPNDSLKLF